MNVAYMSAKERMEYLQKRKEEYDTFHYYAAKVQAWMGKKTQSEVVMEEAGVNSFYRHSAKEVHIRKGSDQRTYGHEFGHEFYYRFVEGYYNPIDILEMWEWFLLLVRESEEVIKDTLNSLGSKKVIRIFTDALCCLGLNVYDLGYWGHEKNYAKGRNLNITENETFAEFFSGLYTEDWECYEFMINYFPKFVESCFLAIDKGITATA